MNTTLYEPQPFPTDIGVLLVLGLQEGKCTKTIYIVAMSLVKVFQAIFDFQAKA